MLLVRLHDTGHRTPCDADVHRVGDLDDQVVLLVDLLDDAVQTPDREDLVAGLDRLEQLLLLPLTGALRANQQRPQQDEHRK